MPAVRWMFDIVIWLQQLVGRMDSTTDSELVMRVQQLETSASAMSSMQMLEAFLRSAAG